MQQFLQRQQTDVTGLGSLVFIREIREIRSSKNKRRLPFNGACFADEPL
jgi:hypothetical protein